VKILHVPYVYYPDAVGGTEVYVEGLVRELANLGVHGVIAAPAPKEEAYEVDGLAVRRFGVTPALSDLRRIYGQGDDSATKSFARILDREQVDVVHLHAFTSAVSIGLVRAARSRGARVVFTYHTPAVSCARGTLLRWGTDMCDGVLKPARCAACVLDQHGVPRVAAHVMARLPLVSRAAGGAGLAGGAWTALRMRELIEIQHGAIHALLEEADHIVAVCEWARELLLRNGLSADKISVSRHGLAATPAAVRGCKPSLPLRVVYAGRLDASKGVDLLLRALSEGPELAVQLDILGVAQGAVGERYRADLQRLAGSDARVRFLPPVPHSEVVKTLSEYDVLAVPSRCLETGPLVVLEAFAAGVPVLGSDLGGIAELVSDGIDGLLVREATPAAWRAALCELTNDDASVADRLRLGVKPARNMATVAADHVAIYERVVSGSRRTNTTRAAI